MHKPDTHPVDNHVGGAFTHRAKPREATLAHVGDAGQLGKVTGDGEVHQLCQQGKIVASGREFEVAEADERWGHATDDRPRLCGGVAIVEHVTHHVVTRGDERKGPCGWYPQVVHGFTAEELTNGRTQHGATIGAA